MKIVLENGAAPEHAPSSRTGWGSGETACLSQMKPGFNYQTQNHTHVC